MGVYDLPATIDLILDESGEKSLYYVGYSMGTTQYMIALSELPELNDKIAMGFLMAPCGHVAHATSILTMAFRAAALSYDRMVSHLIKINV